MKATAGSSALATKSGKEVAHMPMQKKYPGNARQKRNCWSRGNGPDSMKGELKGGIRLNKKRLNRKVRHQKIPDEGSIALRHSEYRRICRTGGMVDFT